MARRLARSELPRALAALARKYEAMRALRAAPHEETPRAALRALSREFPGALAELDRIEGALLDARATEAARLSAAADDEGARSTLPSWAHAWLLVHVELRGALSIKRRLGGARRLDEAERAALREAIERDDDDDELRWIDRLDAIAAPPGGRLLDAVLADVAETLSIEGDLRALLMPRPTRRG